MTPILAIVKAVNAKSGTSDTIIEFTDTRTREYCEVLVGGRNDGAVLFHLNGGGPTCYTTHEDTSWRDWEARSKRCHYAGSPEAAAEYIRTMIPNALKP